MESSTEDALEALDCGIDKCSTFDVAGVNLAPGEVGLFEYISVSLYGGGGR